MKLIEYPDGEMMMMMLADKLAGELNAALKIHDAIAFAVPGGTTPAPIYEVLCAADLDWDRVTVVPTDERWVPETSEHSNARLIKETLLVERAAAAQFFDVYTEGAEPDDCIGPLSQRIRPLLPLSVLLLGMGADMHTASLFPGANGLEQAMHVHAPPFFPIRQDGQAQVAWRMSLTLPVLREAMSTHLVIAGAEKRAALERARKLNDPMKAPVSAILADATVHWAE